MSKPNLLGFSSSIGIYRNQRMRDLRSLLKQSIHRKIDFAEVAPMLFQAAMAFAGENQIDGDFSGYNSEAWREIFLVNHIEVTNAEAAAIKKGFEQVGLFDHGKIRSWSKYNRHFAEHEKIINAKRKAGKIWQQKRAAEARQALKKPNRSNEIAVEKPLQNGSQNDSASKQLWLLENALKTAKGKARRELLAKKQTLLEGALDVDLSERAPKPQAPLPKPHKESPGEFKRAQLKSARGLIEGGDFSLLTPGMVTELIRAGDELPPEVRSRFRSLLGGLEKEEPGNPVPG